jgi:adenosine deaminase
LAVVPNAGLLEGADNVRLALEILAPTHIAHGVRTAEDSAVLEMLAKQRITCDVCPSAETGLGNSRACVWVSWNEGPAPQGPCG